MFTKAVVEKYFDAEKQESMLFMLLGILAVGLAMFLFVYIKTDFVKGLVIPLIAVGLIEFVVGLNVYRKSDQQRIDMVYSMDMDKPKLRNEEIPRMKAVIKQFVVLRYSEIVLFMVGAVLCYAFRSDETISFWYGFGLALSVQALLALVLDFFAHKRGIVYLEELQEFLK